LKTKKLKFVCKEQRLVNRRGRLRRGGDTQVLQRATFCTTTDRKKPDGYDVDATMHQIKPGLGGGMGSVYRVYKLDLSSQLGDRCSRHKGEVK